MATHLPWLFPVKICRGYLRSYLPWELAVAICRGNLPWLFAVGICRGYLPWEFAVAICRWIFLYVSKSFLVYVSKSCLYGWKQTFCRCEQIFFICEMFFFNGAPFCYCRGSYGPPYCTILYCLIFAYSSMIYGEIC